MKTYNETLQAATNLGYTHIEIDGQLRDIDDIIATGGADGDTGDWVLDARAHLADLISGMESERDEQLIDRVVAAAVTLDNPTAAQLAEAELHRCCSPRFVRNGHSVGVCAGDISAAHRAALDGGAEVLTGNGAILRARRSGSRCYYNARLQPGYRWSDSYSKNPTPVRA